jgi:hypothetical protein
MTLSVCLSVSLSAQNSELLRNGASDEKVLAIKVVGYYDGNSGVPSAVTLDDL